MLAWGRKASAEKAQRCAKALQLPICYLEDAFLRSVGQGFDSAPCGMVVDDLGVYYDAMAPSRLEQLIVTPLDNAQHVEAQALPLLWRQHRVSKYNNSPDCQLIADKPYVLLIDQTFNDASVHYGLANADSFRTMLQFARTNFADYQLVIKTHPDVVAGKKKGYLANLPATELAGVQLISERLHVVALLEHASAVLTVTSQVGFEALLWQKPVYVFGMPFYAGWGLTQDMLPVPARRLQLRAQAGAEVDIGRLAYAAFIRYGRYVNDDTQQPCSFYQLIQTIAGHSCNRARPERQLSALR
nr:hypothetical protein [Rheinheimera maricola]